MCLVESSSALWASWLYLTDIVKLCAFVLWLQQEHGTAPVPEKSKIQNTRERSNCHLIPHLIIKTSPQDTRAMVCSSNF